MAVEMLFSNIERMFAADAQAKNLVLRIRPSKLKVEAQPIELIRMLVNLTANAIKFTDRGGVLIVARKEDGAITFQMWDTGEGLGLAIVKELAAINGYGFDICSKPGLGSVCSIRGVRAI